jgi:hypothetical protein
MILYKLTDKDGYTRRGRTGETLWGPGVSHTATGDEAELCTDGVIHAYTDPWLGLFLNPIHANIDHPRRLGRWLELVRPSAFLLR